MKLTILFIFISGFAFGQSPIKKEKTISVTPNSIQVEKINSAYKEKIDIEVKIKDLTELVIGYKLEDIDSLRVENGQYKFILKPKNK